MSEKQIEALEQEELEVSEDTQVDEASYPGSGQNKESMSKSSESGSDTGVNNEKTDGPKPNFTKGVPSATKRPLDKSVKESKMAMIKSIYDKLDEMTKEEVAEVLGALDSVEEDTLSEEEILNSLLDQGFTEEEIQNMSEEELGSHIEDISTDKQLVLNKEDFETNLADDVQALIEGEELSDEFKEKAATIFEAAVFARVNEEITERVEKLEEQYKIELENAITENRNQMIERVDDFMGYVVKEWMEENQLALDKGIRSEIVEDFMVGLKNLFVEHYIDIPDEKVDLVDDLFAKVEDLEESLNKEIEKNIQSSKQLKEYKKLEAINVVSEDLTDVQKDKMKKLAEGVEFDDVEQYVEKLHMIKENYFPTHTEAEVLSEETTEDDLETVHEDDTVFESNDTIRRYADAITRTLKK
jgi:hypothetical protein